MSNKKMYEIAFQLGASVNSSLHTAFASASKNIENTQNQIGNFNKKSGLLSKSMTALKGSVLVAGAALGGLAVSIGKTGFEYNMMAENSQVAWETLLGSQGKAITMLKDVSKFARNTQFDTEQVDMMAKYMHNAGLQGKSLFNELTKVADVSGAFNIPAQEALELTRQMSQVRQAGVAYTEDLNVLQDRGVPIFKAISEQLGITVADVRKMASDGKITSDIYLSAFDKVAKGVAGSSKKQSQTMSGMWSTLKDNLKMIKGALTADLFKNFKNTLKSVMPIIETFTSTLSDKGLKEAFVSLIPKSLIGRFSTFSNAAKPIGKSFISIFNSIKSVAIPILQDAINFMKDIFMQLTQFWNSNGAQIMKAVQNVWSGIAAIIKFVAPIILFIVKTVFGNVKGLIQGALNVIIGLIKIFAGLFTGDFSKIWEGVKQLFRGAIQAIWNLWNLLMVGKLVGSLKALGLKFWGFLKGLGTKISTNVQYYYHMFVDGFYKIASGILKAIGNGILNVLNVIKNAGSTFIQVFTTARTFGVNIFMSIVSAIRNVFITLFGVIRNAFSTAISTVLGSINGFLVTIKTIFTNLWTFIVNIFNLIKTAMINPFNTVKTIVRSVVSSISGLVKGMFGGVVSTGKGAVNGLIMAANAVIGGLNGLKINIPKWVPKFGGKKFGLSIPAIPMLAKGGITTGPTLAMIGEGAEQEAVLPLSKLEGLLNGSNQDKNNYKSEQPIQVNFNPQYIIQGNADQATIERANVKSYNDFKRWIQRYEAEKKRLKFN